MRRRPPALLLLVLAVLGACGSSSASASQSTKTNQNMSISASTVAGGATLACIFHELPVQGDLTMVHMGISCTVTGAAASETSFSVRHVVADSQRQGTVVDATCGGPVSGGVGACGVTVTVAQAATEPGMLVCELLPSGATLGPLTPGIAP